MRLGGSTRSRIDLKVTALALPFYVTRMLNVYVSVQNLQNNLTHQCHSRNSSTSPRQLQMVRYKSHYNTTHRRTFCLPEKLALFKKEAVIEALIRKSLDAQIEG